MLITYIDWKDIIKDRWIDFTNAFSTSIHKFYTFLRNDRSYEQDYQDKK